MQEKTLETKHDLRDEMMKLPFLSGLTAQDKQYLGKFIFDTVYDFAREEGRKDIDENLRTFVRMSIDNNWQFTEEQVIKAEMAWEKLMKSKLEEVITQYKEELKEKMETIITAYCDIDDYNVDNLMEDLKKLII
jgi:hypothetical protein